MAIYVVWSGGARILTVGRWCADAAQRGLAKGAVVATRACRWAQAKLPIAGRHAQRVVHRALVHAGDQLALVWRAVVPIAHRAWAQLPTTAQTFRSGLRRGLSKGGRGAAAAGRVMASTALAVARATGRALASRVLRRSALASASTVALLWALATPALRLGADIFAGEVDEHGLAPLEEPSTVVGPNGDVLTLLPGGPNREVVPLPEIPEVVKEMVVAVEDQHFWGHSGWDGEGMVRAALANVRAGEVAQGGSTISQQLAKENFAGDDRTLVRKVDELLHAVALEERYAKPELLEYYLNQVYLGSRAYGVAAAAQEYFGVAVADLSPDQAALLVGLIRSPSSSDPRVHPEAARQRRDAVLRIAAEHGVVEPAAAERFQAVPLEVVPPPPEATDPLLAEAVRRELLAEPALGATVEERSQRLATGGLRIESSIDPHLQAAATRAVHDGLAPWPGLGGALAAVDPHQGRVRALVSANPPGMENFDLAAQGRRQPGSTFKPLAAIAALEAGLRPGQELAGDGPVEIEYAPGRHWAVDNFGGADHGAVDLEEALASSVNTALAQVAVATGTEPIVDVARRLGIDVEAAMGSAPERGPALALGALSRGVSPLEMASAYGVLATGGRRTVPTVATRVTDPHGRELLRREPEPQRVLDPAVAGTMTKMLQEAVAEGTGEAAQLPGWKPAGKTGTTQENADAWFVGVVPTLSVATWLGQPDAAQPVRGLTGGSAAASVWREFMATAIEDVEPAPFPEPPRRLDPAEEPPSLPEARRVRER